MKDSQKIIYALRWLAALAMLAAGMYFGVCALDGAPSLPERGLFVALAMVCVWAAGRVDP